MKNRLEVARELLRDNGIIFIHIDDQEDALFESLAADDIFGRENFIATVPRNTRIGKMRYFINCHKILIGC